MITLIRIPAIDVFRFATTSICLPLGLSYITASLEGMGERVKVIDAIGEAPKKRTRCYKGFLVGLRPEEIVERIPEESRIVCISVIFTHEWPILVHLVNLIRERKPDCTIVLGGEHVTSMPEFCLMTSKADVIVLGEGEETIRTVVRALKNKESLELIDGIGFRRGDRIVINPRRSRETKIDDIPYPAWHHFNLQAYMDQGFIGGIETNELTLPILATRGCPYQCTYCSAPNMWTPLWLPRDPVKVVDEIEHHVRVYGARNFPFQDLTAIIKKEWIVAFCQELLRRDLKISWQLASGTRSEAIDLEVATLLKKTNMVNTAYAPESGSESTRKLIKKHMKTDRLMKSIEAVSEAGLNVSTFIVLGFPHDTRESIRENLAFVDEIAKRGVTDLSVAFYMALPGTELFHSLYDAGRITLNRPYFRHILDQLMLFPSQSYCDSVGRAELAYWKIRLLLRFYSARRKAAEKSNLFKSIARGASGLFLKRHSSKLQTALRNAVENGWHQIRVYFKRPWVPAKYERQLFEDYDAVFRQIRSQKLASQIATQSPEDTTLLHKRSVVNTLRRDHESRKIFAARSESEFVLEEVPSVESV